MFTENTGGVPNIITSGGEHGFGGGSNWIFALVIIFFALVFLGGGGGLLGNRNDGGVTPATGAAFTELNGRLNAIEGQISHVNDLSELRALYTQACATDMNVTQQAFNLSTQMSQNNLNNLLAFKDAALQTANCCCETQRSIDAVRFQNEKNTCDIMQNNNANTQRIIDQMTQTEITMLRDKLAEERLNSSQCAQNAYLVSTLRPYPQPTYQTCNPTQSHPYPPIAFNGFGYPPYVPFGFNIGCCPDVPKNA